MFEKALNNQKEQREIVHREFEMYEYHSHSLQQNAAESRKVSGELKTTPSINEKKEQTV